MGIACIGHIIEKIIRIIMGYLIYIYVNIQHCPAMCDIRVCVKMRMPEIHGHLLKKMMIMGIEGTPCSDKAISNGEVPRIHTCYGCFSNNHQVLLPFRSFTFVDSGPMHNFLDASLIFMGHDLALPHSLLKRFLCPPLAECSAGLLTCTFQLKNMFVSLIVTRLYICGYTHAIMYTLYTHA